ncbi:hypothetical protein GLOTRDRAFT_133529 [Gloeophyllum trabeum ATCC 11539]|uniref:Uncharacterized protein n=1 Tax=Gloeophyllum trabeum (strain ATCC 11539 / FP-39264 / Madison 617) TaxID=670483 RepID=S7PTW3_GLOTA|nr:uncharacterized protein GLOTRDRAFT_133529 [Gloeophyllum trabeum ATCC 11539]EPQ50777.1 hypothetical protein GLOTRDRAFT_133529 [Gloeophyllum trabeum ATCC 11539]
MGVERSGDRGEYTRFTRTHALSTLYRRVAGRCRRQVAAAGSEIAPTNLIPDLKKITRGVDAGEGVEDAEHGERVKHGAVLRDEVADDEGGKNETDERRHGDEEQLRRAWTWKLQRQTGSEGFAEKKKPSDKRDWDP